MGKTTEMNRQHRFDVEMLEREQAFNAEQSQVAYDRQREFYNMQFANESEYNSPLSQMQRYKQAGLNPFLANMDNGATSVGASSQSAASASGSNTVNAAAFQNNTLTALGNIASIAQGMAQLESQSDLNKSQEVKNYAEATKTAGVDTEETKENIKKIAQETATGRAQELNTIADTEVKKAQKENIAEDTKRLSFLVEKYMPKQMDEIAKRIEDLGSQIWQRQQVTPAEVAQMYQEIAESVSRVKLNESHIDLNSRQSSFLQKQIDSYADELQARLNLSGQEFQQLQTRNSTLKLRNSLINDILTFDHSEDNFMDTHFRDKVFRLRALMTLDPEVKWQFVQDPRGNFWHNSTQFNFGF